MLFHGFRVNTLVAFADIKSITKARLAGLILTAFRLVMDKITLPFVLWTALFYEKRERTKSSDTNETKSAF